MREREREGLPDYEKEGDCLMRGKDRPMYATRPKTFFLTHKAQSCDLHFI